LQQYEGARRVPLRGALLRARDRGRAAAARDSRRDHADDAQARGPQGAGRSGAGGRARRGSNPRRQGRRGQGVAMTVTIAHYLVLAAILFSIAVAGIFINRKNVLLLLMCIELMLLAVNFNFIAFSRMLGDTLGQIFVFFI